MQNQLLRFFTIIIAVVILAVAATDALAESTPDKKRAGADERQHGDGGFILKIGDKIHTSSQWKAKNFFHGPVNGDVANPRVVHTPIPTNWQAVDFDDSQWKNAKEYTEEEIGPKSPYFEHDFNGAKWIWSDDLKLDNTVIFRFKVNGPKADFYTGRQSPNHAQAYEYNSSLNLLRSRADLRLQRVRPRQPSP